MKTSTIKTLAMGIIAAVIVTSCSLEKRHYTSGYSVQWNSKKTNVSATEASYVAKQTPKTESKKVTTTQTVAQALVEQVAANNNTVTKTLVASAKKTAPVSIAKTKATSFENTPVKDNAKIVERIVTNQKSSGGDGDTTLIIEIILCFFPFFNLISMYLKDGKRITLNFWVDLILDCLFFLPGIIFALLVVLDVVNLA